MADEELTSLLREIRDGQRLALERQAAAIEIQRAQFDLVRQQTERNERIQARAEALQERSAGMMKAARVAMAIILPVAFALVIYLSWLIFR
jgi:uncharacterized membrane protein (DUF106 family)